VSLRLYEKISLDTALADAGLDLEEISFSLLTLALNYASIVEYLGLDSVAQESVSQSDSEALRHLATWLFVTRTDLNRTQLGESRNMKLLAAAVASPNGLEALGRGETVEEAATATLDVNDLFRRSIRQSRTNLISAQRLIHRVDVARPDVALLEESLDLLEQLLLLSRRRMRGNGV
jgi:hypothetical protein